MDPFITIAPLFIHAKLRTALDGMFLLKNRNYTTIVRFCDIRLHRECMKGDMFHVSCWTATQFRRLIQEMNEIFFSCYKNVFFFYLLVLKAVFPSFQINLSFEKEKFGTQRSTTSSSGGREHYCWGDKKWSLKFPVR